MVAFGNQLRRFLAAQDGPTAVEYAVILAVFLMLCLAAVQLIGANVSTTFTSAAGSLAGS